MATLKRRPTRLCFKGTETQPRRFSHAGFLIVVSLANASPAYWKAQALIFPMHHAHQRGRRKTPWRAVSIHLWMSGSVRRGKSQNCLTKTASGHHKVWTLFGIASLPVACRFSLLKVEDPKDAAQD